MENAIQQQDKEQESMPIEPHACEHCEENEAKWKRAIADYQNLQKEVAVQRGEWVRMSEVQILEEFLPVYSNFKKAFAAMNNESGIMNHGANWVKGIEYIMKQFGDILKAHGIEEIKTVGEMFDPRLHEAVGEEGMAGLPAEAPPSGAKAGTIVREVDTGYMMKGKVIRVAKVVVAKGGKEK